MDAFTDPATHTIVVISAAQVGKSEAIMNVIGYIIDHDPASILWVLPTLEMAQTFSKDRLAAMIADTPALRDKVRTPKSKDSGNTLLRKEFPGGHIHLVGSNSPAGLASRPVRVVLLDEVDRYDASAGAEGDPVDLAVARARTFWNRKILMTSTPTIKGVSRIEKAYEASDQRRYHVPCPHCDQYQILVWENVLIPSPDVKGRRDTTGTTIACIHCGADLGEADRLRMIRRGEWRASEPFDGVAGFHLDALCSPWTSLADQATRWIDAAHRGSEAIRVVVNTDRGETFEEKGESADPTGLLARVEDYGQTVPAGACVLTAGVDVQGNRLEVAVTAWGPGRESWNIDYRVLHGNPATEALWLELDQYLLRTWKHAGGADLPILCCAVDSSDQTDTVYKFCVPRQTRRVYPVKGLSTLGAELVKPPPSTRGRKSLADRLKAPLHNVNTDQAKRLIMSWLSLPHPGPGYMHFPAERDAEYFAQLTAEKMVTRYHRGQSRREWVKQRPRNEALDLAVYNLAALEILIKRGLNLVQALETVTATTGPIPSAPAPRRGFTIRNKGI